MTDESPADVCLIIEGTYPYAVGGVAAWTHELIKKQGHLTFHILSILPRGDHPYMRYDLPRNVRDLTTLRLQEIPGHSDIPLSQATRLFDRLRAPLTTLTTGEAGLRDLRAIIDILAPYRHRIGESIMLNSEATWELITSMYETSFAESSMLDYFWSWRAIVGNLYSLLITDLPAAKCYHTLSTGYAGVLATRAKLETERPVILTEHGIYTNERRIEIGLADWLEEDDSQTLTLHQTRGSLRDLWLNTFANYSRLCYEAATHIVTLYAGNQQAQITDGAHPAKMRIIPNGIDVEHYRRLPRKPHPRPTIALIGRVVPIKDVKGFLRACAAVAQRIPTLRAFVIGPTDEDSVYAEECRAMASYYGLQDTVTFTGRTMVEDYLPEIDILVSTSISEAQPLVILEAGACGIPAVVSDVGACREMVLGRKDESPLLGPGGIVAPLSNLPAIIEAICALFSDRALYERCGHSMQSRVERYYHREDQGMAYKLLYESCLKM
ncbi:MAG: GT4 family glycosyltransferase PelF, partial [Pseudomonadota bacterium]|nr:GT4 family glycosyltransferase PelF [Pseudomonadota bacterium]